MKIKNSIEKTLIRWLHAIFDRQTAISKQSQTPVESESKQKVPYQPEIIKCQCRIPMIDRKRIGLYCKICGKEIRI